MKMTEESSQEENKGKEERKPEDGTLLEGAHKKIYQFHTCSLCLAIIVHVQQFKVVYTQPILICRLSHRKES